MMYRVIKKTPPNYFGTWTKSLNYFNNLVFPANFETFPDVPNCFLEYYVQYQRFERILWWSSECVCEVLANTLFCFAVDITNQTEEDPEISETEWFGINSVRKFVVQKFHRYIQVLLKIGHEYSFTMSKWKYWISSQYSW